VWTPVPALDALTGERHALDDQYAQDGGRRQSNDSARVLSRQRDDGGAPIVGIHRLEWCGVYGRFVSGSVAPTNGLTLSLSCERSADRLLHHAHVVITDGNSIRLAQPSPARGDTPSANRLIGDPCPPKRRSCCPLTDAVIGAASLTTLSYFSTPS
jgi:hypothetical protein